MEESVEVDNDSEAERGVDGGASASSRVFNSARSLLCVARTEHLRHMQSLRISSLV